MANEIFFVALTTFFVTIFYWGFKNLTAEGWQIMATVPLQKEASGTWRGVNLTYYGFFNAMASSFAFAIVLVLMGAINAPRVGTLAVMFALLVVCLPAARIVARVVERKRHTFTIAGAFFVGVVIIPWMIQAYNALAGSSAATTVPTLQMLASLAIAYCFGEAVGRLACISFGCCYGKSVAHLSEKWQRRVLRFCFVFKGETKKVAYEGQLNDAPVIPIQAVTAVVSAIAGLGGTLLFLNSHWTAAVLVPILTTQIWRIVSEVLRADYRGAGRISRYQFMAAIAAIYTCLLVPFMDHSEAAPVNIIAGLRSLSRAGIVVLIQGVWLAVFLFLGRSSVTSGRLAFGVVHDRI